MQRILEAEENKEVRNRRIKNASKTLAYLAQEETNKLTKDGK
jgi:hypothetical protein